MVTCVQCSQGKSLLTWACPCPSSGPSLACSCSTILPTGLIFIGVFISACKSTSLPFLPSLLSLFVGQLGFPLFHNMGSDFIYFSCQLPNQQVLVFWFMCLKNCWHNESQRVKKEKVFRQLGGGWFWSLHRVPLNCLVLGMGSVHQQVPVWMYIDAWLDAHPNCWKEYCLLSLKSSKFPIKSLICATTELKEHQTPLW